MDSYQLTGEAFHQTIADVTFLKQMAAFLPLNPLIINIGACFGTSAMALAEARADAFIFSIDITISPKETDNLKAAGLYDFNRVIRLLGASQSIGRYWREPVDMVYVDGDHSFEGAFDDVVIWRRVIKPGGIMAIHDYGKAICPQVKPAVDAAMAGYKPFAAQDSMIAFRV